ncbi:hypothetical protein BDZ85DRAFT_322737 [Elsinoe ampelina]|uniref:Rhodopsin domain-containing protein n=1 Tax=Elsinoe ampelina TaxID=302913 RepID=A0A6A6G012_9PEZI|nr:hypothetical protein BDZ85DRAFT_322737 [Elsinoe ampelina]
MQEFDEDGNPVPNIHPEMYIAVVSLSLVLSTLCVALRFYVRASMIKSLGRDDWVLLAAHVVYTSHALLLIAYAANIMHNGLIPTFLTSFEILEFQGWIYALDQGLIKGALAAFFLKVLPKNSWQRKVIWISFILFGLFTTIFGFLNLFQCGDPLDLENPTPTCLSLTALQRLSYTSAAWNTLMDWLLTLMPITVIYRAQMSSRTKWSVILLMMLGAFASVISIVRIPYIDLGVIGTYDTFTKVTPFVMLALWENCVGIMAVSLAALRPLVRKVFRDEYGSDATLKGRTDTIGGAGGRGLSKKDGITVATSYEVDEEMVEEKRFDV